MFDENDQSPSNPAPPQKPLPPEKPADSLPSKAIPLPDDIFAQTDPLDSPRQQSGRNRTVVPDAIAEQEEKSNLVSPKLIVIIIAAVILVIVVFVAVRLMMGWRPGGPAKTGNQPAETTSVNAPAPATQNMNGSVNAPVTPPLDSDGDGLSNNEESGNNTNPNLADTDNDQLTDYEEVKVYKSNPLSQDSDADGYQDGSEVKGGYDPTKGGGAKLFDLQAGIKQLNSQ